MLGNLTRIETGNPGPEAPHTSTPGGKCGKGSRGTDRDGGVGGRNNDRGGSHGKGGKNGEFEGGYEQNTKSMVEEVERDWEGGVVWGEPEWEPRLPVSGVGSEVDLVQTPSDPTSDRVLHLSF